jgi:hypothetical protein
VRRNKVGKLQMNNAVRIIPAAGEREFSPYGFVAIAVLCRA